MVRSSSRRLLRNLGFAVLTAGLVLGVLELGLRLAGYPDPGIYAGDPGSVWTLQPNLEARQLNHTQTGARFSVRTNSLGYRGPLPQPGGIAALGCSTTFGWGVEEEQAWPAVLQALTGKPVLNGGVPGHSTWQGRATLAQALEVEPSIVILAWLVRDAERTTQPDHLHRPSPPSQVLRAMRALQRRQPQPDRGLSAPSEPRVPPENYRENLLAMAQQVERAGAIPVLLAFPMQDPPRAHLDVLYSLAGEIPLLEPRVDDPLFFERDPLHLRPEGHEQLAHEVAHALRLLP